MDDDRVAGAGDAMTRPEQSELQVAVLAPGGGEALVEAADRLEHFAAAEAVGRDELRPFESGRVALVVGGHPGDGDDDPPAHRGDVSLEGRFGVGEPPRIGDAIVVRERDDRAPGPPATRRSARPPGRGGPSPSR